MVLVNASKKCRSVALLRLLVWARATPLRSGYSGQEARNRTMYSYPIDGVQPVRKLKSSRKYAVYDPTAADQAQAESLQSQVARQQRVYQDVQATAGTGRRKQAKQEGRNARGHGTWRGGATLVVVATHLHRTLAYLSNASSGGSIPAAEIKYNRTDIPENYAACRTCRMHTPTNNPVYTPPGVGRAARLSGTCALCGRRKNVFVRAR